MAAQLKDAQTFRVFFSSPFKGMEEERTELTRKYFPEIQHKCAEMGLQFVPVDMRWGISAESAQNAQTINICLREIDRSDMFICFFGQRYGWHGHADGLLQENIDAALGKYPWLDNMRDVSVTELELCHGHLNNPGALPAVILFRDKKFDAMMHERQKDKPQSYTSEDDEAVQKLTQLRDKVKKVEDKALAVHMDYPNPYKGAKLIYESIIEYLNKHVLKASEELPRRELDIAPHNAFAVSRTSLYVSSHKYEAVLDEALAQVVVPSQESESKEVEPAKEAELEPGDKGIKTPLSPKEEETKTDAQKPEADKEKTETCPHVLVLGPSGSGKSGLLCNWIQNNVSTHSDVAAIPYYIGCAPSTRDPEELLDFVYGELDHLLGSSGADKPEQDKTSTDSNNTTEGAAQGQSRADSAERLQAEDNSANHNQTQNSAEGTGGTSGGGDSSTTAGATAAATTSAATSSAADDASTANANSTAAAANGGSSDSASASGDNNTAGATEDVSTDKDKTATSTENSKKEEKSDGDKTAVDGDKTTAVDGDKTAVDGDKTAVDGDKTPVDGDKKAVDGDKKDSDADKKSSDGEEKEKKKEESRPKGKELQYQVLKKLQQVVEGGKRVVLVFDAVNRLVIANKTSKTLHWLPENTKLPQGVMVIISTDDTDQASIDILHKQRGYQVLKLEPLDDESQEKICVETLKRSGKELSPAQLERVVKAQQTSNPLFLKIVLAELSIFGYFRKLDAKIDSLIRTSSVKELLHNCLERLEADYNPSSYAGNLVGEILQALFVAQQGLTESEIINIFHIEFDTWSPLFFAMEYFIVSHQGLFGFAFNDVRDAVKDKYLQTNEAVSKARRRLIAYFDGVRTKQIAPWSEYKKLEEKPNRHAIVELVWLLRKEEDKDRLISTLADPIVLRIMNTDYELELLELWQWTGLKWSEVVVLMLKELDRAIVDCYLAMQNGEISDSMTPGQRMRGTVAHMRSFFDLTNTMKAQELVLAREIEILEHACHKMVPEKRKEFLRDARYYLACTYASQDLLKKAKEHHESNLQEIESALKENPEDVELQKQVAYTNNGIGLVYMNQQNYDKAIEYISKSGEFHANNKDKKNQGASLTNLALCYMYKQMFNKALEVNQKALEAYEEANFGQLSLDIGNIYTNMGLVYRRMKNLDKAEETYLKSLEIKANAVGWEHPIIATAFMNLGTLEMHRKNFAKAEQWTRKAIAVYQANELEVTRKEYRRCRENVLANMMKQDKYEESLPLFIEVFDILKENGWLDECLAVYHRRMATYMLKKHPDMWDKAEEIHKALINSPKAHPDNYLGLVAIEEERSTKRGCPGKLQEQEPPFSLDSCLERFPSHNQYGDIVEIKLQCFLLPKEDKEGIRDLVRTVARHGPQHKNYVEIVKLMVGAAREESKVDLLLECMKGLAQEEYAPKLVKLYLRACVEADQLEAAIPVVNGLLDQLKATNSELTAEGLSVHLEHSPVLLADIGRVLITKMDTVFARKVLLHVRHQLIPDDLTRSQVQALLDSLPDDPEAAQVAREA